MAIGPRLPTLGVFCQKTWNHTDIGPGRAGVGMNMNVVARMICDKTWLSFARGSRARRGRLCLSADLCILETYL